LIVFFVIFLTWLLNLSRRPTVTQKYLASFDHFIGFSFFSFSRLEEFGQDFSAKKNCNSFIPYVRNQWIARLSCLCSWIVAIFVLLLFDKNSVLSANSATCTLAKISMSFKYKLKSIREWTDFWGTPSSMWRTGESWFLTLTAKCL